ncbi:MAG: SPOR domain-containing protein [Methylocystis sp.]|nr:SPOR domain-containing protein [Methylocystis sp.]
MSAKDTVELWRSIFELLKSLALVFIVVSLFVFPQIVHHALTGIGVAEFDLWGFKGKTALATVAGDLQEAQVVQRELAQKLTASDQQLKTLVVENDELRRRASVRGFEGRSGPNGAASPTMTDEGVRVILAQNGDALKRAADFQAQAAKALSQNAALISSAKELTARGDSRWIVIFGSDVTEDDARAEVKRATAQGFDNAYICLKRGRYRSVIEFDTLEAATAALPRIKALSGTARDAYVVNLGAWCPRLEKRDAGFIVCS